MNAQRLKWIVGSGAAVLVAADVAAFIASAPRPSRPVVDLASVLPPPPPAVVVTAAEFGTPIPLKRAEILEAQQRLWAFGFNPGTIDGNAGPMTHGAILRYQQERGRMQTGTLDREMLDQLRHDPARKVVAQRAPRHQPSGPLGFVRTASNNLSHWLNSIGR